MSAMRLGKLSDERPGTVPPIEGEVRDTIQWELEPPRRPFTDGPVGEAGNLNSLIERVATTSVTEIEKLISELQTLRDFLYNEGQRVQREIAGYAHLSQAAMNSARLIADSLSEWKGAAQGRHTPERIP
jgi:hypothetical protein